MNNIYCYCSPINELKLRIFEEKNSHKWITIFFILIFIGCVLLTTGCVSQNKTQNTSGSILANATYSTPVQTQCPPSSGNTTPYININPIGVHYQGDFFEINGTTNLGVEEKLCFSIDRTSSAIPIPVPYGSASAFIYINGSENITYGDILIIKGGCNEQKWSFWLNTSGNEYDDPTFYVVNVTSQDMSIYNSTSFDLRSSYLRPSNKGQGDV